MELIGTLLSVVLVIVVDLKDLIVLLLNMLVGHVLLVLELMLGVIQINSWFMENGGILNLHIHQD